jgi:mycothiol synthase
VAAHQTTPGEAFGGVPAEALGGVPADAVGGVPAEVVGRMLGEAFSRVPGEVVDGLPAALRRLAERCLRADGGMPLAVEPWFLRRRWAAAGGQTFALCGAGGELLAAGAVCPSGDGAIVTGLVDPDARGLGLGGRILDRGLELAAGASTVTVETESLTDEAAALFAARGLRQVFAEDVMRVGLAGDVAGVGLAGDVARVGLGGDVARAGLAADVMRAGLNVSESAGWPSDAVVCEWSAETAGRFHAVYRASFRERPGFPDEPAAEWIAEYAEDEEFRRGWSVLVSVPGLGDVGFVTAALGWIVQVGVAPAGRGRGLGAALIRESLGRMAADGGSEAWLNVNVNNPRAAGLYRRLGFAERGRRARYSNELAS